MEVYDMWEMISQSMHVDTMRILTYPTAKLRHTRAMISDHKGNLIEISIVMCDNIESELYYE